MENIKLTASSKMESDFIVRFSSKEGVEIIKIKDNGDFIYMGKLITNDKEIPALVKEYFKTAIIEDKRNSTNTNNN